MKIGLMLKTKLFRLFSFILITTTFLPLRAVLPQNCEGTPLLRFLRQIPGAQITVLKPTVFYKEAYEIRLPQPLDHHHPEAGFFYQKIYLSHLDFDRPIVLVTAGYRSTWNSIAELSRLLKANQIRVEHRFFGDSRPDSLDWRYLTAEQAAADHHRIVQLFRKIYPGGWVSTGRSKGGQTALLFRYYYPPDVQATVAYVAPLNRAQEDPRIDAFIRRQGGPECRQRITAFQLALLQRRREILPLFYRYIRENDYRFYLPKDETYEYAVLEYPFTFWQWKDFPCDSIPPANAPAEKLFAHFRETIPFNAYYGEAEVLATQPAYYQFFTELGYYGYAYNDPQVLRALQAVRHPTNRVFTPREARIVFHPELMEKVIPWLQNQGNRIIYIYGGKDPWSATGIELTGKAEAYKFVKPDGNHRTRIADLMQDEQDTILSLLKKWLKLEGD